MGTAGRLPWVTPSTAPKKTCRAGSTECGSTAWAGTVQDSTATAARCASILRLPAPCWGCSSPPGATSLRNASQRAKNNRRRAGSRGDTPGGGSPEPPPGRAHRGGSAPLEAPPVLAADGRRPPPSPSPLTRPLAAEPVLDVVSLVGQELNEFILVLLSDALTLQQNHVWVSDGTQGAPSPAAAPARTANLRLEATSPSILTPERSSLVPSWEMTRT